MSSRDGEKAAKALEPMLKQCEDAKKQVAELTEQQKEAYVLQWPILNRNMNF